MWSWVGLMSVDRLGANSEDTPSFTAHLAEAGKVCNRMAKIKEEQDRIGDGAQHGQAVNGRGCRVGVHGVDRNG